MSHSLSALFACAALAVAAPVPFPKPGGDAAFARIKAELNERGVGVLDVRRADNEAWLVTFRDSRDGCGTGGWPVVRFRVEARSRVAAAEALLRTAREDDERRLNFLRSRGVLR